MTDEVAVAVTAPIIKLTTVWAAVGITSWADAASFAATCYTLMLIAEWCWKTFVRNAFIRRGWIKYGEDGT